MTDDSGILGVSRLGDQSKDSGHHAPPPGTTPPATPTEVKIAAIWQDALSGIPVYRESDFIAIGGDSLALAQVVTELETAYKLKLTVEGVANNLVLKNMADMIDRLMNRSKA
jgi:fengycin family lipopeptide synthetase D